MPNNINKNQLIDSSQAKEIAKIYGTPAYVYSENLIKKAAREALTFPNAYGLTVRYAMKASPNKAIINILDSLGLEIDASSGNEVHRALNAGVDPKKISLSAQQLPGDLLELIKMGVKFNACSLNQLKVFGELKLEIPIGLRFNPGSGSGGNNRTNVGGVSSSFGIWHEHIEEVKILIEKYSILVERIHTHIGSGSDPKVWLKVASMNFSLVEQFNSVKILNLGGGYKVARMPYEDLTNLEIIGGEVKSEFIKFFQNTGRKIHLEIEPGTFLLANAGAVLAEVNDIVDTGKNGYNFIKINSGMTELLRPSIYGSQHPITIFSDNDNNENPKDYVVVGHCCESGDILTPSMGEPELLDTREYSDVKIGDLVLIEGAGAYSSAMSVKNYNSFTEASEILILSNQDLKLIRKRQSIEQIWQNET